MRLRPRLLIWFGAATLAIATGLPLLTSQLLLRSYVRIERDDAQDDLLRVRRSFDQVGTDLHLKTIDWSEWDDTYRFAADRNSAFVRSNMVGPGLAAMKLDLAAVLDSQRRLIYSLPIHRTRNVAPPDPRQVARALTADRDCARLFKSRNGFYGLLRVGARPLLVSVRPIVPSWANRPPRGWFLFARYFGEEENHDLAERTRLDVALFDSASSRLPADCAEALHHISAQEPHYIRPLDGQTVAAVTRIPDVFGKPYLLLRVSEPRSVYRAGVQNIAKVACLIALAALLFSGMAVLMLDRFVLSRLTSLTSQVQSIGKHGNFSTRVILAGCDELSSLASTLNEMLTTMAQNARRIRQSEEERRKQIEHQAFHDALTELPNRALFMDRLSHATARARRSGGDVGVLFLDLDDFKAINDSQGHDAGDTLLKTVASRLAECVRPGDTVARLAGDEFTVLLGNLANDREAIQVAERIIEAMRKPVELARGEVLASASVGIAMSRGGVEDPESLIRNADTAMYHAKVNGKGDFAAFDPGMGLDSVERNEMESGIRCGLEKGEFRVYYQPLVSLATGRMTGVEALVRWQHPVRGLVPPGQFVHIAEETGLIVPLGFWVLETACRQLKEFYIQYPDYPQLTLNVNLSGRQLQVEELPQQVAEVLISTGFPAGRLKLEITESVLMTDMEDAVGKLERIKRLGVKLAIDDFGTGYSSMSSLNHFPVDTVKIDRSFIERLPEHEDAGAIVSAIATLAKTMRMDVTAEGIETVEQIARLQDIGCDTGQGYYFAKPMPAAELKGKIAQGWSASLTAELEDADEPRTLADLLPSAVTQQAA